MLVRGRMDGQDMVYSHNGILHSNENEQAITIYNNMDEFHRHSVEPKEEKEGVPYTLT